MNVLLKSAIIIAPGKSLHRKKRDLLIEKGRISKIATTITAGKNVKIVELPNLHISTGWFDTSVSFGEPGYEERETLANGLDTAAKSGFTGIALNPITNPVADNRNVIRYLIENSKDHATNIFPIGSMTKEAAGLEMAELYDMQQAGAVGFYDYKRSIANPNLLKVSLQYAQAFNGLLMSFPQDVQLSNKSHVNESEATTRIGMRGNPNLAEEIQIGRDLQIIEYTGGRLHIPTVTTEVSVKLIKQAQKKGLQVTCSVSAFHLYLTDDELGDFNTNLKLSPPLRTEKDRKALIKAVKDGTIQSITSDHQPLDIELKKKEFAMAKSGSIGLESFFGALGHIIELDNFIDLITNKPRKIFGLPEIMIEEGATANLSLFNPDENWKFSDADILSTSKNAALLGKSMKGRSYGIYNNKKLILT